MLSRPQGHSAVGRISLKIVTVVQQIVTEFSEAVSEKQNKITFITKMVLNKIKWAARIHTRRPIKVIAFNINGIWRRRSELSKQLQDLYIDVTLLSETQTPREVLLPNYYFYRTDRFLGRRGITHNHVCYTCNIST
jgi:ribosomal protein L23